MNCQEYKGMIEDALDVSLQGELKVNIQRHLEHCSECREYLAMRRLEHAALFAGVNAAYSHLRQPPADFADRIVREVEAQRTVRRGWRRLSLPRWALIAAARVAVAGFVLAATIAVEAVLGGGELGEREGTNATEEIEATDFEVVDAAAIGSSASSVSYVPSNQSTKPNQQGETKMRKGKAAAAALTAAMAAAPLAAANGDEYQFIDPATYPAANVSHSARSAAMELETGALRVASAAGGLEARSRTRGASNAIALETSKFHALLIIFH